MRLIRIALSGKMRSGKDTLANELVMRHGFVRVAFADKLKGVAKDLFGVAETGKNRALLQELGRRLCQMDPAVWISYATARMPLYLNVVVTDLRFPNEYHALRGLGFLMVRIEVDLVTQRGRFLAGGQSTIEDIEDFDDLRGDPSETALDSGYEWDLTLDGAKSADEMYGEIRLMLEHLAAESGIEGNA